MEPSRKALQQPRPLSAAPGSSVLNRPGPAREFKLQARVYRIRSGPARLLKTTRSSQGSTPQPQGTARQSGLSTLHQAGLQHLRSLTAAPGSTVLNRPAPLGSSSYKLGFIGLTQARPACSSNAPSPGSTPPLQGTARPVRFIGPTPGRPATTALRCAGFYGSQQAGPARRLVLLARVHRAHSGPGPPGPPAQVTRLGQGSTPRFRGRPGQYAPSGSSTPHRVGLTAAARHSGSSAPHQGVGPL